MRTWKDPGSPWGKQLRFDPPEFEWMMDELRERTGNDDCFAPRAGVDVDLVLRRTEKVEADYVELPDGILGRTLFASDGSVQVEISRALSDKAEYDSVARRRLRATVAHECGHIACHRILFFEDTQTYSLFRENEREAPGREPKRIMCREQGVGDPRYAGEWWEYQANQCMAALMLPRRLFNGAVESFLASGGHRTGMECLRCNGGDELVRSLASHFDASQQMTLCRLHAMGHFPRSLETPMLFED